VYDSSFERELEDEPVQDVEALLKETSEHAVAAAQ
jgi:hypothetical protein